MKATNVSLLDAVLTLKSQVGNFSAQDYEKATGKAWDFTYDDMEIEYFGDNEFKSITYKNKFIEEDYFTFSIPYIFLEENQDALLDLYLILKEMENCREKLQNNPLWEKKNQNQIPNTSKDPSSDKSNRNKRNSKPEIKSSDTYYKIIDTPF